MRLGKRTSKLFRLRADTTAPRLDVSDFSGVLAVDRAARTADVLGMTTYEHLVDRTLPQSLMPLVVPQLKTSTLGGAVTGLSIESTSFRHGLPHEPVIEMDVLTGDGRVVTCGPTLEPELFAPFPNSYGTLRYALRLRIEFEPTRPYVHLTHVRVDGSPGAAALIRQAAESRGHDGEHVDVIDGTLVRRRRGLRHARGVGRAGAVRLGLHRPAHLLPQQQHRSEEWLTVRDYLWRGTPTGSGAPRFGVQRPAVRRLVPRRFLRSDTWWRIAAFKRRHAGRRGSTGVAACPNARRWCRTSRSRSTGFRTS